MVKSPVFHILQTPSCNKSTHAPADYGTSVISCFSSIHFINHSFQHFGIVFNKIGILSKYYKYKIITHGPHVGDELKIIKRIEQRSLVNSSRWIKSFHQNNRLIENPIATIDYNNISARINIAVHLI